MHFILKTALLITIVAMTTNPTTTPSPYAPHYNIYPRSFSAPYTPAPLTIDTNLDKPPWTSIEWSERFNDIQGADAPSQPPKSCRTRMKMSWDENYLYIAAEITSDFEITATYTERNSPIYRQDSDFEVFLDPCGSSHNYKEFEVNPLNVVWNLMLDRPYMDGGAEHSGRVANPGEDAYYDVLMQKSAVKLVQGDLNTEGKGGVWVVELAMAHSDTLARLRSQEKVTLQPKIGTRWRINFSRVEKKGEVNWTWQPQRVWDPISGKIAGMINMHLPDAWGYVEFVGEKGQGGGERDVTWPARLAAANIYYAQRYYYELNNGVYAASLKDGLVVDKDIVDPFEISIELRDEGYSVTVKSVEGIVVTVNQNRLFTVIDPSVTQID